MPTDADINFYPKLALNELNTSINTSEDFSKELLAYDVDTKIEESIIKSVYNDFVKKDEYKAYQEN